jgi:PAS domain-containing protein
MLRLLRETDGTPYGVGVFVQDLSELRRAEHTLTRRQALFEALERQASEWALVLDANAVLLYISHAVVGALGYDPSRFLWPVRVGILSIPTTWPTVQRSFGTGRRLPWCQRDRRVSRPGRDRGGRWVENVFTNCLDDPDIRRHRL